MKLQQINEVFEKPSLDGIEINPDDDGIDYKFKDSSKKDSPIYKVEIFSTDPYALKSQLQWMTIDTNHNPEVVEKIKEKAKNMVYQAEIGLSSNNSYDKTGLKNQFFVYGKLLACIQHYIQKRKPISLYFGGASEDMNLVYDRFIKLGNKLNPNDQYLPIGNDVYIRKEISELIPNFNKYKLLINQTRKSKLDNIKRWKNEKRNSP